MKVQGRDCTLTVVKDGYYYPLPYSEETVKGFEFIYAYVKRLQELSEQSSELLLQEVLPMLQSVQLFQHLIQ